MYKMNKHECKIYLKIKYQHIMSFYEDLKEQYKVI